MSAVEDDMSYKRARGVLGVSVLADDAQVRRAYHACAKRAHPDRPGGDAEAFLIAGDRAYAFEVLQGTILMRLK